jgi:DNA-binding GntR family transcriptional regulator
MRPFTKGSQDAMSTAPPQSTLSSSAYERIRQDILRGELAPGLKLRIDYVTSRYGIGSSPVREALSRLTADELVERHEQRGFVVAQISIDQLREVIKTRCWLEEVAIREAIRNATEASEDALVVALHHLSRTPKSDTQDPQRINPKWEERHAIFHDALIANCGSTLLFQYCRELRGLADRYRLLAAASVPPRKELDEHKAIFEAVIDRSAERASALLREHYGITQAIIEQHLSASPAIGSLAASESADGYSGRKPPPAAPRAARTAAQRQSAAARKRSRPQKRPEQ